MKRKKYGKPMTQVVLLQQQCHILTVSNGGAGAQDYDWNEYDE